MRKVGIGRKNCKKKGGMQLLFILFTDGGRIQDRCTENSSDSIEEDCIKKLLNKLEILHIIQVNNVN